MILKNAYLFLICISVVSCKKESADKALYDEETRTSVQQKICLDDSITVNYLLKVSYTEAKKTCSLTIQDHQYQLRDIVPFGKRVSLKKKISKEDFQSDKLIKEVTWESKDLDYITVWYLKEASHWLPIDAYKYGKNVRF